MKVVLVTVCTLAILVVAVLPPAATALRTVGTATSCTNTYTCTFALNSSLGSGWASTTSTSISFQLPGEPNATRGAPYSTSATNVSGNVFFMVGSFLAVDASTGKIVTGSTFANVTVTTHCHYKGCTTTYSFLNGSIAIRATASDATTTVVACTPSNIQSGNSTQCAATVTDLANVSKVPTGRVSFSTTYSGAVVFGSKGVCILSSGSCSIRVSAPDDASGTFPIYASYHGVTGVYKSTATTYLYVTPGN